MIFFEKDWPIVEEEKQKVSGVYVYENATITGGKALKIGESMNSIFDRNHNQQQVTDITKTTIAIFPIENMTKNTDKKIHSFLKKCNSNNFKFLEDAGTDEAFEVFNDDGIQEILDGCKAVLEKEAVTGKKLDIYGDIYDLVKQVLLGKKSYVLDLCARWGKTNTVILLVKRLDMKINILLAYVGTVDTSYEQTIKENKYSEDFSNIQYVNLDDDDAEEKIKFAIENDMKIFAYLQCTGDQSVFDRRYSKIKKFLNKKNTNLFIEEADFGMHCDNQISKIEKIPHKRAYILSGTGFSKVQKIAKVFKVKETIRKDYLLDVLSSEDDGRRKDAANVSFTQFLNSNIFSGINGKNPDTAENWTEMMRIENGRLKYEYYFSQLFTAFFNPGSLLWLDPSWISDLTNCLYNDLDTVTEIFVPSGNEAHKLLCDLINRIIPNACAAQLDGDCMTNKKAEKEIKDFIKANRSKRKFIVCAGMANRSFSIKEIKNIVILLNEPSQDSIAQKISRGLTPWNGKTCKIVDLRLSQEVWNYQKFIEPTVVTLYERGKTKREVIEFFENNERVQFFEHVVASDGKSVLKKLDADDIEKAMMTSGKIIETIGGLVDADKIKYNLDCSPDIKPNQIDMLNNPNVTGQGRRYASGKKDGGSSGSSDNGDNRENQVLSSKRLHQQFLLNAKGLFYNRSKYTYDVVKSTIQDLIDSGCDAAFKKELQLDLHFLLLIIEQYEKAGFDFDKIIKYGKCTAKDIKKKKKKQQLYFSKVFCNVEPVYDIFASKISSLRKGSKVVVAFFNNYYFIERMRRERPDCTFISLDSALLNADYCISDISNSEEIVNILNMINFDNIIMNPPYDGRLHLEILQSIINTFPEAKIVNLSPIRWLEDPCAEYKKCSDFKKFSLVRSHIERLEKISNAVAENAFGIGLPYNLGLYTINEKGGWSVNRDPLLGKMIKKVIDGDVVKNHIVEDDMKGLCLLISLFTGGGGGGRDTMNTFSLRKDRCFFKDCYNEFTGKTYLEQRKKTAWGNVGVKSENTNIKFNSEAERENFWKVWNTKTLLWYFNKIKVDIHVHADFLPWLGDYTHEWTDEMLYKYFDLTKDEIKLIESEIK